MHGGDTYGYQALVDLSANVHPLGMPPQMVEALHEALLTLHGYPDPQCRDLRRAIARRDGVEMETVVCGNGAADLIFALCQAIGPKQALLTAPTFGEYGQGLRSVGCEIQHYLLHPEKNFAVDEGILEAITAQLDMLFLCTPNNPTGQCVSPELLERIALRCQQMQCYLVVDECFLELCQSPHPFTDLLENPYVVLLRAFTKSHGMAGLRLGYCLSQNQLLRGKLTAVTQPWRVSTLAQVAGVVACDCDDWPAQARHLVNQERPKLLAALQQADCQVWPGVANYLLFRKAGCTDLQEQFLGHGVLIRSCGNYPGLGADYYRIAIGKPQDNKAFLKALEQVCSNKKRLP